MSPRRRGSPALFRSASIVAAAFVASRLLGLVREVIVAYRFGTSGETSAYVAAFRIPDLLFLVVMAGAFGSAFIPVFAGFLARDQPDKAWDLASAVVNAAAVAVAALGVITFALADPIVRFLVAPDLPADEQALTANLMRLLLLSPIFLGLGIAAKGILEAQDRFVLPALAPLVYNGAIILGALILAPWMGVYGLAVGVVVGAIGHIAIQVPGLLRSGFRYVPSLDLRTEGLAEVWRLLLPRVVGQAAFQVNFIVVTAFASTEGEQGIAALNFAWQLMMLPHGVLALSISTVIFPTMARLFEQGRIEELRGTFGRALRPLLFLTLPAAVGLFAFRTAIVRMLFQWGAFSSTSTDLVAAPLAWFALGLLFYALVEVLTRAFYAMHDTRTPVVAGVVIIAINIALCAALVGPFGLSGLALGLSASTAVEAVILGTVLVRRLGAPVGEFGYWLFRVVLATLVIAGVAAVLVRPLNAVTAPDEAPRFVQILFLGLAIGLTSLTYGFVARLVDLDELDLLLRPARRVLQPILARLGLAP